MTKSVRRRVFLLGGVAAGLSTVAGTTTPTAAAQAPLSRWTGAAVRRVGPFEIVALLDASGPFFLPRRDAFTGATEEVWARAERLDPGAFGPDGTWNLDFRCFAVRLPSGGVALVDAGVGPAESPAKSWAPVPGVLLDRLAAAGIARDDVRLVVLTHLHEDHFGWSVSPEGVPYFPSARYVVQRTEISALERAGDEVVLSYVVEPLRRTGQLDPVDGEVCLGRGRGGRLSTMPTPGHTPGHQSVLVHGTDSRVVITGDVLVHAVQLVDPDVSYRFEADQDTARRTRRALLDDARPRPTWLATAHLSRPFVRADEGRCRVGTHRH
ncbi:MBL fold metallo-hydrolase [Saccharomonospora cyanea]|uniref:Zn-dependent hydrolase, glyoxylase n=1 Tax=Saccharomonospora cyanea NA-134 TaxID=882082 RepID=H5XCW8_9PSEU|nr:MBL fold metallo-hydrolase [Saccharomonospora cyanea]EHR62362.1 Zn-dependent hydrolase, glyoxylase [Saccharomonospora cyanea NA-134]